MYERFSASGIVSVVDAAEQVREPVRGGGGSSRLMHSRSRMISLGRGGGGGEEQPRRRNTPTFIKRFLYLEVGGVDAAEPLWGPKVGCLSELGVVPIVDGVDEVRLDGEVPVREAQLGVDGLKAALEHHRHHGVADAEPDTVCPTNEKPPDESHYMKRKKKRMNERRQNMTRSEATQ